MSMLGEVRMKVLMPSKSISWMPPCGTSLSREDCQAMKVV